MTKDIQYLIIPDVHGREFWKEPVEEILKSTDAKIIFEGDYHDPYMSEPQWVDMSKDEILWRSIDNFTNIINLKKTHPERIILLLGNHDCGYAINDDICSCRMDWRNRKMLENLFKDNRNLFQVAYECNVNERHFIFSHSGILKGWAEIHWGNEINTQGFNIIDRLNCAWAASDSRILDALGDYDQWRGFGGYVYGSPVWSDIRSWTGITQDDTFGFNITGHTRCSKPIILNAIVDLDCSQAFYLDSEGDVRYYAGDELVTKHRI